MSQHESWWQAYPALKALLPLVAGIGFSAQYMSGTNFLAFYFLSAVTACLALGFLSLRCQTSRFVVCWHLFFFLFWLSVGGWLQNRNLESTSRVWPQEKIVGQAVLLSSPREGFKTIRADAILLTSLHRDTLCQTSDIVSMTLLKDSLSKQLQAGDALTFYSTVRALRAGGNPYEFDYTSYLKRSGVVGNVLLYPGSWQPIARVSEEHQALLFRLGIWTRIKLYFMTLRQSLVSRMQSDGLDGDAFSVYAALTLGDKSHLSREIKELYAQTGTSHILALSGMHLGILLFFFYYVLGHGIKYTRWKWPFCLVALMLVWFYTLLAGLPVSLVRATVMYTFSLCGMLLCRKRFTLNILYWTAVVMLLFQPSCLFDVGFQLSFSAMLGILLFQKRIEDMINMRGRFLRQLWSGVSVSLAAQLTTTPLVVYYFHYASTNSVISTMFLSVTTMLLLYALPLYLLVASSSWLAGGVLYVVTCLVHAQHKLLDWFSSWPYSRVGPFYMTASELILLYILLFSVVLFFQVRRKILPAMLFLCVSASLICSRYASFIQQEKSLPMLVFYNNYRAPSVHLIHDRRRSYLLQTKDSVCWEDYRYIKECFWNRYSLQQPLVLSRCLYRDNYVCAGNGLLCTSDFQLGMLHSGISPLANWNALKRLDYLYLCRGFRGDVRRLLKDTDPGLVVLDGSLSDYERQKYVTLCLEKKWKYHDMRLKGALKVAF